jgi:predicted transglutaminase-like cysteine proteinase
MSECPHGLFDVCCTNYERCTLGAPKKEWVGLTDEEIKNSMRGHNTQVEFARALEAKLKEKNSG